MNNSKTYEENLQRLEEISKFMGGDHYDVPISYRAVDNIKFIIEECHNFNLRQPDIFPWAGGIGVQAEWEKNDTWYLEITCGESYGDVELFYVEYSHGTQQVNREINCKFSNVYDAFDMVKLFLEKICKWEDYGQFDG